MLSHNDTGDDPYCTNEDTLGKKANCIHLAVVS